MTLGARERVMQTAEKLVARGKISQAIREYRKLLRQNPNDANMLNRVGDLYARQDKVDEAVELFEKIAEGYGRDGFFVKAIAIYKKIIRLDPTQLAVYERLAELYHRQGLISEARSQYLVLVDYYTKHQDMAATIEVHRKMADLEPNDPSPRVKLAELYLSEGLVEETIGEYQRIAELMLDHGRVEEASKVYIRALDVDSDDLAFISEAVLRLREEGELEAAGRVFEAAVERNPEAAKLAERMREHAAAEAATADAVEADEEPPAATAASDERAEYPDDSVAMADILAGTGEGADVPDRVSDEEIEQIMASSEIDGVEVTEEGAFVIGLEDDDAPETDAADQVEALAEEALKSRGAPAESDAEEVEIDLADLEASPQEKDKARAKKKGKGKKAASKDGSVPSSVEALAESLGLGASLPESEAPAPVEAIGESASSPVGAGETAPAARASVHTELAELLAEAEVFAKYGLESKALRRLDQALVLDPGNFEAQRRLVLLQIQRGVEADVIDAAQQLVDSENVAGGASWEEVLAALSRAGFSVVDGKVQVEAPKAEPTDAEPVEESQSVAAPAKPGEDEDEGLEWLDKEAASGKEAELFEVEEEFFDLAAEIEKEITSEPEVPVEATTDTSTGEESLEEIVEGFKQGVAEVLSPDAYETHYNLGIAYREMDLVDEAIGEFQLCAKDPDHLIDSCSMLGACFLEKGFPDLSVKWYKRGLDAPSISEDESLSLLYDLGSVYASSGEREAAYEVFVEIYGINSHYRDVVARLEELRAG